MDRDAWFFTLRLRHSCGFGSAGRRSKLRAALAPQRVDNRAQREYRRSFADREPLGQIEYLMCELEYDQRAGASGPQRGSTGRADRVSQEFGIRTIWKLALTYQLGWS